MKNTIKIAVIISMLFILIFSSIATAATEQENILIQRIAEAEKKAELAVAWMEYPANPYYPMPIPADAAETQAKYLKLARELKEQLYKLRND